MPSNPTRRPHPSQATFVTNRTQNITRTFKKLYPCINAPNGESLVSLPIERGGLGCFREGHSTVWICPNHGAPFEGSQDRTRPHPAPLGAAKTNDLWQPVSLPHCVNADRRLRSRQPYFRGEGWYRTRLGPAQSPSPTAEPSCTFRAPARPPRCGSAPR
jgi:hypothetical protein